MNARGLRFVTVCPEQPDTIQKARKLHGFQATMLSDPKLEITDMFNIRNPFNITFKGVEAIPIPTTILVSAAGIVTWIDQAKDYQERTHPERVYPAIDECLGARPRRGTNAENADNADGADDAASHDGARPL